MIDEDLDRLIDQHAEAIGRLCETARVRNFAEWRRVAAHKRTVKRRMQRKRARARKLQMETPPGAA